MDLVNEMLTYIVCTRNRPNLLEDLLRTLSASILKSKGTAEILIIDSASIAKFRGKNASLSEKFSCRYSYSEKPGLSLARNIGVNLASTPFIFFLDDDVLIPEFHTKSLHELIRNVDPDLLGGPVETLFPDDLPRWYDKSWNHRTFETSSGFGATRLSGGNFGGKVEVFKSIDGFNEKLGMQGSRVKVGEERDFIERYIRQKGPNDIYYSLDLKVLEPLPKDKTRFTYRIRREFAVGSALVRKTESPYTNKSLLNWFLSIDGLLKKLKKVSSDRNSVLWTQRFLHLFFILGLLRRNLIYTLENKRNSRKIAVVIFFEHAARELPTALGVRECLSESKRYKVVICNLATDRWLTRIFKPDICIIPYFYNLQSDALSPQIKKAQNTAYISLSWEQIFYPAKKELKIPKNPPENMYLTTWTKKWYDVLLNDGIKDTQIFQLGHPVWSFLSHNRIRTAHTTKPSLLYVENSSLAFSKLSLLRKLSNHPESVKNEFRDLLKGNLEVLHEFQKDQELDIVIRVRPATRIKDFKIFADSAVPNNHFTYTRRKSLQTNIKSSNFVITEMSTSVFEAALLEKHAALLQSSKIPKDFQYDWFDLFPVIRNIGDLRRFTREKAPDYSSVSEWMQNEGALSENYFNNLMNLTDNVARVKQRKSFIWYQMFQLLTGLLYFWQSLLSNSLIRRIIFKTFIKKFSYRSHEKDFPAPWKWESYRFKGQ